MIKQQIYRRSKTGYRTVAVSSGLRESAWLPLLEQQALLRYQSDLPAPVYFQYPFGCGLVLSRCGVDPNGRHGSYIAHQLVADEQQDIDALILARPLSGQAFLSAYAEHGDAIDPLPTLKCESLAGSDLLSAGFRLIDALFSDELLSQLIASLLLAARDKQKLIHITLDQPPAAVSEQGRLLLEMLMRVLPVNDVQRLSYCTLLAPSTTALQYSVCVSPPVKAGSAFSAGEHSFIHFDLTAGCVCWPDAPVEPDEQCRLLAQALLAHDLNWADRVREGEGVRRQNRPSAFHLDIPAFEKDMLLTQYVQDWADALEMRRSVLNEDAFLTFAQAEWPRLIGNVINAADLLDDMDFTSQLCECILALSRGHRAETLGMSAQNLADLVVILLDSINWDQVDLFDPSCARLIKNATSHAAALSDSQCDRGCLTACRAMHALLASPVRLSDALDDLNALMNLDRKRFDQIQACARRYVASRCRAAKDGFEEFTLVDEPLAVFSIAGYVRFAGGVPDLRQLDKVRDTILRLAGPADAKKFSSLLDRMRKKMHASRSNLARKREMSFMLGVSLALALLIAGVVAAYFLFIH